MSQEAINKAVAKIADLMTVRDVSQFTGVPEPTLRYWRHVDQGPPSFKVGARRVMYRREDVEAWLAASYATTRRGA